MAVCKAEDLVKAHEEYQHDLHAFEEWLEAEQEKLICYTQLEGDIDMLEDTIQKLQVWTKVTSVYLTIMLWDSHRNIRELKDRSVCTDRSCSCTARRAKLSSTPSCWAENQSFFGVCPRWRNEPWKPFSGSGGFTRPSWLRPVLSSTVVWPNFDRWSRSSNVSIAGWEPWRPKASCALIDGLIGTQRMHNCRWSRFANLSRLCNPIYCLSLDFNSKRSNNSIMFLFFHGNKLCSKFSFGTFHDMWSHFITQFTCETITW